MVRHIYEQNENGEAHEYPSFVVYAPDIDSMTSLYFTCVGESEKIWIEEVDKELLFHMDEDEYEYAIVSVMGDPYYVGDCLPKELLCEVIKEKGDITLVCQDEEENSSVLHIANEVEKGLLVSMVKNSQKVYFNDICHDYDYSEAALEYFKKTGDLEKVGEYQNFVFELDNTKCEIFFLS